MYGKLDVIIGNMFSGKSSELIRRINTIKSINSNLIVINYILDNRYSNDSVCTHDKNSIKCLKTEFLLKIDHSLLKNIDYIFIDEGQFFTDLYDFVKVYVDIHRKHVIVSGLDGDYNRNKFGHMIDIIPLSDSVVKLKAYCIKCSNGIEAPFTKKIINENFIDDNIIDIGSDNKYIPVCRYHYFN